MLRNDWLNADALFGLAWTQAWQLAVVAAVVALVTALACRRRPHLAYLLWLLVLVKAVTPPVWSSPTGAFSWALNEHVQVQPVKVLAERPPLPEPGAQEPSPPSQLAIPPAEPAPVAEVARPAPPAITPAQLLLAAWALGAIGLAAWLTINWLRLARCLRHATEQPAEPVARQFAEVKDRVSLRRPVRLLISRESLGPAALGWWRGTVLVPQSVLEQSSQAELDAIFAHELVHIRRFDPLVGTVQLAVQCVWWWHPAVWWANRQVRIERERSCDEAVLAQVDVRPADYARLLVELLERSRAPVPAVFWSGMRSTSATTARVRHVLETKTFRRRSPFTAWVVAALALAIVLPGAGSQFITAAPPEASPTPIATPQAKQQTHPEAVPLAAADEVDQKQTPAEAATFQALSSRGATWSYAAGPIADPENSRRRWAVTLPNSFDPGDAKLSLVPLSRILLSVTVGQQGYGQKITTNQLRTQLLSLTELPAETVLFVNYTAENASALDALPSIPNLTQLGLFCADNGSTVDWSNPETRPFAISDLKRLTNLTMSAVDGDLPEIARLTNLEQLGLHGNFSSAAINDLKSLTRLKSLTLYSLGGPTAQPLDVENLDQWSNLERLNIGGLLNDAAAKRIGALSKLHDLSISVDGMSDAGLAAIAKATSLRTVHLSVGDSPGVTARGFAALSALKNLERLSILGWARPGEQPLELTDESVIGWDGLANLRFLVISHCSIGDAGIRTLSSLPILYCLQLEGPLQVTDAGVAELKHAPELGALVLTGSKITGTGLAPLKDCRSLGLVNLSGSRLTDVGLESLASVKLLSQLDVSGTKVTDKGLAAVTAGLPQLTRLNLARTAITDAGLSDLKKQTSLKQLNLADTSVTVAGIGRLLDANRQLMVWSLDPMTPQTRAFEPGIYQGTFQPIDGNQVLGELLTAKAVTTRPAEPAADASAVGAGGKANEKQLVDRLQKLGLRIAPYEQNGRRFYFGDFDPAFEYRGEPLPLEGLPGLRSVAINDRLDLSEAQIVARLKALRNLRADTQLLVFFGPNQPAATRELANIPNLRRLSVFRGLAELTAKSKADSLHLSSLKNLKQLSIIGDMDSAVMEELQSLVNLEDLGLHSDPVGAAMDLSVVKALPQLRKLSVSNIPLQDAAFRAIAGLKRLEYLNVELIDNTDEGVQALASVSSLKDLQLKINQNKSKITPGGLAALGRLEQLESLLVMHLPAVSGRDEPLNDVAVAGWAPLKRLKRLQLFNCQLNNASLLTIGQLAGLELLEVSSVRADEDGLQAIAGLSDLKQLDLYFVDGNGDGIEHLAALQKLEHLTLGQATSIDDAKVAPLAKLANLELLHLPGAKLRGAGLAPFAEIRGLTDVSLRDNPLDDAGAEALARLAAVTKLDLAHTQITDAALATIARGMPALAELNLNGTKITATGLDALSPLKNLKQVLAMNTAVTEVAQKGKPWSLGTGANEFTGQVEFRVDDR